MDGIPLLSQAKSLVQLLFLQPERALETQKNFTRQCPGVSQVRSLIELIDDDEEAALETQKQCVDFVGGFVNSIPVVGHAKGAIHYACGDSDGGAAAMKASTHSAAVAGGGVAGFLIGGPPGAVAVGITAGVAMDTTITIVDTEKNGLLDGKDRTYGFWEPFNDPTDAGKWVDAGCGLFLDGLAAKGAGKIAGKIAGNVSPNMTVLKMVRNESYNYVIAKVLGKAKVIILQDLLTDVGPMVVSFDDEDRLRISFRNLIWFVVNPSSNGYKCTKDSIEEIMNHMKRFPRNGNSEAKREWTRFWKNPKRVAVLLHFLERAI